jgi:HEAT repeat protein
MKKVIEEIFELDEQVTRLKEKLKEYPEGEQAELLTNLFCSALDNIGEVDQLSLKFVRVVELMGDLDGASLIRVLSRGLDHPNVDVRLSCAETLLHLAEDDLEQISPAIDEALGKGGLMAQEVLYLLAELDDPNVPRVIERFLELGDAQIVALAIDALVEIGDLTSIDALKKLSGDKRRVVVDEEESESQIKVEIGQLAREAIGLLASEED